MLLAFSPGRPVGDTADRIEMRVALTPNGELDEPAFLADPRPWPLAREIGGAPPHPGEVIRVDGGWALRRAGDDDPVWLLDAKRFRPGEYVTLRGPAEGDLIFRVVGIDQE
jgi:hypothetical protein